MTAASTFISLGSSALGLMTVKAQRGFMPASGSMFSAMAVISEMHSDDMEITDHPIERGSVVTDHAFKRPAELSIVCGWSDSPNEVSAANALVSTGVGIAASNSKLYAQLLNASNLVGAAFDALAAVTPAFSGGDSVTQRIYQQLLDYQQTRTLFTIYTGKRRYQNMLIRSLSVTTDQNTENALLVRMTCREIQIAQTQSVQVPSSKNMANPASNASPTDRGEVNLAPATNYKAP